MKAACLLLSLAVASATAISPVTRVVELLNGLSKTIEKDGKAEENLFESYVCWGKSVITQKTASNSAAASKIDTLETYIADLSAGRITLTSGRADNEKDIAELSADVEEANALRQKENADFEDAKAEMNQAISAMKSAMKVLGQATKDHKKGVLMAVRSRLNQGMESLQEQQLNLNHAVKLGERFLDKADATFLRRLLTADVPKRNEKKLNRKANFKMAYKARSFKIQDVLTKMHGTFVANLEEATQNEKKAKASYDQLSKAKGEQLSAAQDALTKSEVENGARGSAKKDAQDEANALKKQVAADEKFISETTTSLAKKKKEWKVRSQLRTGELEAISKTVSILYNDDARDLMKKSFASQEGLFFLQEGQQSSSAASALRSAARKSGDSRLLALASLVAAPSSKSAFKPILKSIDKMIAVMKSEEASDLKMKQDCEKGRMEDTKNAADAGHEIDDMTDAMTKLEEEIFQISKEIRSLKKEKKAAEKELAEAKDLRKRENAQWKVSDSEDAQAAKTVRSASAVLAGFYKKNNLAFVQKAAAPEVVAGEAPPPPPETFDGGYGGKTAESGGILSILDMVNEDILKDQRKAKADEDESQEAFNKFQSESNAEIKALAQQIGKEKGLKGKKQTEHGNTKDERRTKHGALKAVMKKMEDINENCEYYTVNYELRLKNRAVEVDGLEKAKAILKGGKFTKPKDPNREIKPGDAFLQRRA